MGYAAPVTKLACVHQRSHSCLPAGRRRGRRELSNGMAAKLYSIVWLTSSEQRYRIRCAISRGVPIRPMGWYSVARGAKGERHRDERLKACGIWDAKMVERREAASTECGRRLVGAARTVSRGEAKHAGWASASDDGGARRWGRMTRELPEHLSLRARIVLREVAVNEGSVDPEPVSVGTAGGSTASPPRAMRSTMVVRRRGVDFRIQRLSGVCLGSIAVWV